MISDRSIATVRHRRTLWLCCCGIFLTCFIFRVSATWAAKNNSAEFLPLGQFLFDTEYMGSRRSFATGISPNGRYVVGWRDPATERSYIWSRSDGVSVIPDVPATPPYSTIPRPIDVANDGTTLLSTSNYSADEQYSKNYLWHPTTEATEVGNGPSRAYAITPDGRTVVGALGDPAFWTADEGWTILGDLPIATSGHSRITGTAIEVSSDGTTIVGQADYSAATSAEPYTAFRWTAAEGMHDLDILPEYDRAVATAVSADGSVVAGRMGNAEPRGVFRWTLNSGAERIGDGYYRIVMSDDGSIIAWTGPGGFYTTAKVWNARNGVQNLNAILIDAGVDIGGWNLATVTGISADGRTIVGTAINPRGEQEAYLAVLPIPEPSALALTGICITTLIPRRHCRDGRLRHVAQDALTADDVQQ